MDNLELIQYIGNEICEGGGPDRDCELEYDDCGRIANALNALEDHVDDNR